MFKKNYREVISSRLSSILQVRNGMLHWVASVPLCFVTKTMIDTVKLDLPWDGSLSVALFRFIILLRNRFILCKDFMDTLYGLYGYLVYMQSRYKAYLVCSDKEQLLLGCHYHHTWETNPATISITHVHNITKPGEGKQRQSPLHSLSKRAQPESLSRRCYPNRWNIEPLLRPHRLTPSWNKVTPDFCVVASTAVLPTDVLPHLQKHKTSAVSRPWIDSLQIPVHLLLKDTWCL